MEITENLHIGVIYMFTNKINGKKYIGQTINEKCRLIDHKRSRDKIPIDFAIKKYGIGSFNYEILNTIIASSKEGLIQQLNRWEVYYISKYNTTDKKLGYNIKMGGSNSLISEETKRKLSGLMKGRYVGENNPNYGHRWSKEQREHLRQIKLGKKYSYEVRKKKFKSVTQYDLDGNFVKEFESLTEAALKMNCDKALIMRVCQGKAKTAKGYKWKYKEKEGTN